MKVILRKDQDKLGQVGTVVDVKDGYARNFLIPKGIAYPANEGNMRALTEEKKQTERRSAKELKGSEKLAAELEKLSVTIKMKVGEDEKLFGSVTSQMIADAMKEKGFEIDKRIIELPEPTRPSPERSRCGWCESSIRQPHLTPGNQCKTSGFRHRHRGATRRYVFGRTMRRPFLLMICPPTRTQLLNISTFSYVIALA
jgi:large subunit ribosomal protein L9